MELLISYHVAEPSEWMLSLVAKMKNAALYADAFGPTEKSDLIRNDMVSILNSHKFKRRNQTFTGANLISRYHEPSNTLTIYNLIGNPAISVTVKP